MGKIIIFVLIFYTCSTFAQDNKHFDKIVFGTSLTSIKNVRDAGSGQFIHREKTWNLNLSTNINKNFRVGIQYLAIFTSLNKKDNQSFFIAGAFGQYNLLPGIFKKTRLYIETSINTGNYCTCNPDDPYQKDNLYYHGLGLGFDIPIRKWLHFDIGFMNYNILNNYPPKYNYTQYILGLDFQVPVKK